ncbi:DUF1983 domain-containing protein [Serratia phage vB_SlqS_ZDD2]|nr:DUF1983 domain-containing protein [Serratia phage vB_SlqS_ZDD2]
MKKIIGSKGGGSQPSAPYEMPDNLQSISMAKILIALGEGEIWGGASAPIGTIRGQDILLDGTPLLNEDGSSNFGNFQFDFRPGLDMQSHIPGIPSTDNEVSVGTELTSSTPWVREIRNTQLSAIRVRMRWPQLAKQNGNDLLGYRIEYRFELSTDGGAFVEVGGGAVDGKTTTGYERSTRINLPAAKTGWRLRVVRLTPNANQATTQDRMEIRSISEVVDAKMRYPHTALLYVSYDAKTFEGKTPVISIRGKGKIVRTPSNYNAKTREYSGAWDGSFIWQYTNNPAWVYYDLVTNTRYGLDQREAGLVVNKWYLYDVARYCDQPVPDGQGGDGKEPRFTCNVYIQSQADAYQVIHDVASIFRGLSYWDNDAINVTADMPRQMDFILPQSHMVPGTLSYGSASERTNYTSAQVAFSNPLNGYADDLEVAHVPELRRRYGNKPLKMTAFGCTSRGEAHRRGLWAIYTNNYDRSVTFEVGMEGYVPMPGWVIGIPHAKRAGRRNGGRVKNGTRTALRFDDAAVVKAGDRVTVNLPSGKCETRTINAVRDNGAAVDFNSPLSEVPAPNAAWAIESNDLAIMKIRVTSIAENDNGTGFVITGVEYIDSKFAAIDSGVRLDIPPVTVIPAKTQKPPKNVKISQTVSIEQAQAITTMSISWDETEGAVGYELQWRKDNGNWVNVPVTGSTQHDVKGVYTGAYQARVRAINSLEVRSAFAESMITQITGKSGKPPKILNLKASRDKLFEIIVSWDFGQNSGDGQKTVLQVADSVTGQNARFLADVAYPTQNYAGLAGLQAGQRYWFRARFVDKSGNESDWTDGWVEGMATTDWDALESYIIGKIDEGHLSEEFREMINSLATDKDLEELKKLVDAANQAAEEAKKAADEAGKKADQVGKDLEAKGKELDSKIAEADKKADEAGKKADKVAKDLADEVTNIDNRITQETGELQRGIWENGQGIIENSLALDFESKERKDKDAWLEKNQRVIITDQQALAEQSYQLGAQINDNRAKITGVEKVVADNEKATAEQLNKLESRTSTAEAGLVEINRTVAENQKATTEQLTSLKAEVGDNKAAISREEKARVEGDKALAERISVIEAKPEGKDWTAEITELQRVDAEQGKAIAENSQRLTAQGKTIDEQGKTIGKITTAQEALANEQEAQAKTIASISADVKGNTSSINEVKIAQSSLEQSVASVSNRLEAVAQAEAENAINIDQSKEEQRKINASITNEQKVIADQQKAQASTLQVVQAQYADADARITSEAKARADADQALTTRIDKQESTIGGNTASIVAEAQTRADADKALGSRIDSLKSSTDNSLAQVNQSIETLTTKTDATAQQVTQLKSTVDSNTAAITENKQAISGVEQSVASVSSRLEAVAQAEAENAINIDQSKEEQRKINASITNEQKVIANTQEAIASELKVIQAQYADANARITTESQTRTAENTAMAKRIDALEAKVGDDLAALIAEERQARIDGDQALATTITRLESKVDNNQATITQELKTLTTKTDATAQQVTALQADYNQNKSSWNQSIKTLSDAQGAQAKQITQLEASYKSVDGKVDEQAKTIATVKQTADAAATQSQATAETVTQLQAGFDDMYAAINVRAQTVFDSQGKQSAFFGITAGVMDKDTGFHSAAIGLQAYRQENGNYVTQFVVDADRFVVGNGWVEGGNKSVPFYVENNQTFIKSAVIHTASITNAHIQNGAIDSLKIAQEIRSDNYVWNDDPKWRRGWALNKNGYFILATPDGHGGSLSMEATGIKIYDDSGRLRCAMGWV